MYIIDYCKLNLYLGVLRTTVAICLCTGGLSHTSPGHVFVYFDTINNGRIENIPCCYYN